MSENDKNVQQQLEGINEKKETTSVFSFRVPLWLKARILEVAEEKGQSPGGFASITMYKAAEVGVISKTDYEQLEQQYKDLEGQYNELAERPTNDQVEKLKQERDKLKEERDTLKKERYTPKQYSSLKEERDKLIKRPTQYQYDTLKEERDNLRIERNTLQYNLNKAQEELDKTQEELGERPTEEGKEEELKELQTKANKRIKEAFDIALGGNVNKFYINDY